MAKLHNELKGKKNCKWGDEQWAVFKE